MGGKAMLTIGTITGVHGLGGNVKVRSFAESPDTFTPGNQIWLRPGKPTKRKSNPSRPDHVSIRQAPESDLQNPKIILKSTYRKNGLLLTLQGVDNRNLAEQLLGCDILIHRDELPKLDENTWYWEDLYGLKVMDEERGYIGIIEQIFPTGANDILVVKHPDTRQETLIPMHRQFIQAVDIQNGSIRACIPEGL